MTTPSLTADLLGLDRLAGTIHHAAGLVVDLDDVNRAAGALTLDAADIPIHTGALAGTARADVTPVGVALVAGGGPVDYAGVVHARDPFFARAIDQHIDDITDLYAGHLADVTTTIRGA